MKNEQAFFEGQYFCGEGDVEYIYLLDVARRMFEPDPEFQNMPMLYTPGWNGLVEGPKWGMWWIQNSYGATYCALPFYTEPYTTFLQNSQDAWFDNIEISPSGQQSVLWANNQSSSFNGLDVEAEIHLSYGSIDADTSGIIIGDPFFVRQPLDIESVSYTHLTLPTN